MQVTLTPEQLVIVLLMAVLYGPTVIWLAYRAIRGRSTRARDVGSITLEAGDGRTSGPDTIQTMVQDGRYWVCPSCRSVVRAEASNCYRCGMGRPSPDPAPRDEEATTDWVPVMAGGLAPRGQDAATTVAVAAPPMEAARPTVAADTNERAVPATLPEPPVDLVACPYLGFKDDPSSRCDYPDPRNTCHAGSARRGGAALPRRLVPRSKQSRPIVDAHQESYCLTALHKRCPLYRAV